MSYQRSRGIRTTSLKDLILDRTVQGRGLGTSIVSSIKDKTIANVKGVTEKFDPLNIATAFGGSLGGYAFGKLTGRSKEDISYFTGRGGRGSFMDSRKNKNPLVSKVGAGENRPTKKGEGLADIMARIFNLIKKNSEQVKKRQEITANFEEEKEDERALRHKELLEAISNIGGGTATQVGPVKEEKGIFSKLLGMMKNMIEKAFKAIKPILDFVKSIMKALGGKAIQFLKFLAAFGGEAALAFLLPATAIIALKLLGDQQKEDIRKNPNDPRWKDTPYARTVRKEFEDLDAARAFNEARTLKVKNRAAVQLAVDSQMTDKQLMSDQNFGASRETLKKWLKEHPEETARWQAPVKYPGTDVVVMPASDYKEAKIVTPDVFKTPNQLEMYPPGGSKKTYTRNQESTVGESEGSPIGESVSIPQNEDRSMSSVSSIGATQMAAAPSPVTSRYSASQRSNFDLNLTSASSPEPIIIDNSKVVSAGSSGGVDIIKSASVRTDSPTLKGIQKQSLRSFA